MNDPETTTRGALAPTLRMHCLALSAPLGLTPPLQSAGGLLDAFWLGRPPGMHGIATVSSFVPVFLLLLS